MLGRALVLHRLLEVMWENYYPCVWFSDKLNYAAFYENYQSIDESVVPHVREFADLADYFLMVDSQTRE